VQAGTTAAFQLIQSDGSQRGSTQAYQLLQLGEKGTMFYPAVPTFPPSAPMADSIPVFPPTAPMGSTHVVPQVAR
jgi:hypothetical protein